MRSVSLPRLSPVLLALLGLLYIVSPNSSKAQVSSEAAVSLVKQLQQSNLTPVRNYLQEDYQKLRVSSQKGDSSLLVLVESYFRDSVELGYLHQVELMRKESATLPVQLGRVSYFHPIDLFADRIPLPDFTVAGPLGQYGLWDYTFTIDSETQSDYIVGFIHKGDIFPGINGRLTISKLTKKLTAAEFSTNGAIHLRPLRTMQWSETYHEVEGITMLEHSDLLAIASTQIGMLPKYRVELSNDLTRQNITHNGIATTSLQDALPTAFDSVLFTTHRPRSLTMEENIAYERSRGIFGNSSPGGLNFGMITGLVLDPDVIQYNRVEGVRLQLHERINQIGTWPLSIDALGAYGFGDKRWKYDVTVAQGIFWHDEQSVTTSIGTSGLFKTHVTTVPEAWLSVGARLRDDRTLRGTARSIAMNTLSALGYKSDFPDYYWSKGITAFVNYRPFPLVDLTFDYQSERQTSIDSIVATFSILSPHKAFRPNPPINDGELHEIRGILNANSLPEGFGQGKQFYSRIEAAHSGTSIGSDFEYSTATVNLGLDWPVQQWGMSTVYFSGSTVLSGALPNQQLFLFETPRGFSNRTRSFLTIRDRQFQGDRIAMLFLEQNLFDLPTRALGIHFFDPLDLSWFAFANVGYSSISDKSRALLVYQPEGTGSVPYTEAGIGIGNILNLLRVDGAWRLTHKDAIGANFVVILTLGLTL